MQGVLPVILINQCFNHLQSVPMHIYANQGLQDMLSKCIIIRQEPVMEPLLIQTDIQELP
jgi:hypothetical protein